MIPLVFILAVVLIVAAIVLLVMDRRRRSKRTAATGAVDSASTQADASPSLDDDSTRPTGEVTDAAADEIVLTQPDSTDQVEAAPASSDVVEVPVDDTNVDTNDADDTDAAIIVDEVVEENAGDESGDDVTDSSAEDSAADSADGSAVDSAYATESQMPQSAGQQSSELESSESTDVTANNAEFANTQSADAQFVGSESADAQSADADSDDGQPADAQSVDVQPVDVRQHVSEEPAQPAAAARRRLSGRKVRHLRKVWAQQRNATYSRVDHELPSYWQRTPEGDAKAVVSGFAFGREMHLADVGGITTLAIRRSVASDEVFELRRSGDTTLPHVATEAGLVVAATDPELIHRIFDERATRMLVDVHPVITRMWSENSWSLAQLVDGTVIEDWEGALNSLAEFSDIARRLPPAEGETVAPDTEQWDPTRPQLTEQESESGRGHLQAVPASGHAHAKHGNGDEPLDVEEISAAERTDQNPATATGAHAATGSEMGEQSQWTSQSKKQTDLQAIDSSSWRPQRDTPLDPTSLPSRSTARKMGSSVGESEEIGDADQQIPALGQDPEHSLMRSSKGRVVRSNVKPASIFTDMKPADAEDETADKAADEAESVTESSEDAPEARPTDSAPDSADE